MNQNDVSECKYMFWIDTSIKKYQRKGGSWKSDGNVESTLHCWHTLCHKQNGCQRCNNNLKLRWHGNVLQQPQLKVIDFYIKKLNRPNWMFWDQFSHYKMKSQRRTFLRDHLTYQNLNQLMMLSSNQIVNLAASDQMYRHWIFPKICVFLVFSQNTTSLNEGSNIKVELFHINTYNNF
jgi:hypothetical protein